MSRPKGSKNKVITKAIEQKGNAAFNLHDAKPVPKDWIAGVNAITDEDRALDRELEMMAKTEAPAVSDVDTTPAIRKSIEPYTMLSSIIDDLSPAKTILELDDQVHRAKMSECDSIECTEQLWKYYNKNGDPRNVGYFVYRDIKVYKVGFFDQSIKKDKETIEQRLFGASKST